MKMKKLNIKNSLLTTAILISLGTGIMLAIQPVVIHGAISSQVATDSNTGTYVDDSTNNGTATVTLDTGAKVGSVSGSFNVYSDYYDKDIKYDYSGDIGSTLTAEVDDASQYPYAPKVTINSNKMDIKFSANSSISFGATKSYNIDSDDNLSNPQDIAASNNNTNELKVIDGKIYFFVNPWILKNDDDTVTFDGGATSYKITLNYSIADAEAQEATTSIKDLNATAGSNLADWDFSKEEKPTLTVGSGSIDANELGTTYYDSVADAKSDTATKDTTATANKTYYRKVTFPVSKNDLATNKFSDALSKSDSSVTYLQKIVVGHSFANISIPDVSVNTNTSTDSSALNNTNNIKVTGDSNISLITNNDITFDDNFYDSKQDALDVINGKTVTATDDVSNQKFVKNGTYYQIVRIQLTKDAASNYNYSEGVADKSTDILSYVRAINVKAASVSKPTSEWTYTTSTGNVLTKKGTLTSLYDTDNKLVTNRALAPNTLWKTDQYRINTNGIKQYRVSTNEWVNADDVTLESNVENQLSVENIQDVVNLDNTNDYYYLYTSKGNRITNRALAKNTSWVTDFKGEDSEGNTYYRVSTDEWVKKVPGVGLDSSVK